MVLLQKGLTRSRSTSECQIFFLHHQHVAWLWATSATANVHGNRNQLFSYNGVQQCCAAVLLVYIYIFSAAGVVIARCISLSLFFSFFLYFHFTSGAVHLNIHKKLSLSAISTKIDTNNVQDIHFRKSTLAIRKFKMAASFQDGCRSKPDKLQFLKWNSN